MMNLGLGLKTMPPRYIIPQDANNHTNTHNHHI
jgi:hypothetical protein